jgi:hypothetical protein
VIWGHTNGPTNGPTDQRTNAVSYRGATSRLEISNQFLRPFGNFKGLKSLPELIFEAKIGPFWAETWHKINPNKLYLNQ